MARRKKKKLILRNFQALGDAVVLAYAVKSLFEDPRHKDKFVLDVRTNSSEVFEGNPYLTNLDENDPEVSIIDLGYPTIDRSNQSMYKYANCFTHELGKQLGITIEPADYSGTIFIREEEKYWYSVVYEKLGVDTNYVIISCANKWDYSCKQWGFSKWQELIDLFPDVYFVQVGHQSHNNPELKGNNLLNLVGKTDNRQLIRLIYNSFGVISHVSMAMLMAWAIPAHPRFGRPNRACIVIAGGREPNHWHQGPAQQYLHTCGMLSCCQPACWKSRIVPLGDGDPKDNDLCVNPVQMPDGQVVPKCMEMISVEEVANALDKYMANLDYQPRYG